MAELKREYEDILESLGWRVTGYDNDGMVEIENYSPAGENLVFSFMTKDFPENVMKYYIEFNPDEHAEMWIRAKYEDKEGRLGIPSASILVHDAEAIDGMIKELANSLCEIKQIDKQCTKTFPDRNKIS